MCYQQYHQVDRCERYITLADMTFHLSYWLIKLKPSRYQMKATLKGNTWYYLTFAVILHLVTSSKSFRSDSDWVQVCNMILWVPISPDIEDRFLVFSRGEAVWNISCPFFASLPPFADKTYPLRRWGNKLQFDLLGLDSFVTVTESCWTNLHIALAIFLSHILSWDFKCIAE